MNAKTNIGLVEYAKAQLGLPYWYGTYGATATAELYEAKKKQYPKQYTATDFPTQYGKRVHDCAGLIKGYLWSDTPVSKPKYNKDQDTSANGLRKKCTEQGDVTTMPDIPGVLVFMDGHVGVYIGDQNVIEARGHKYGVVQTKLSSRPWKWWGKLDWIDYVDVPTVNDEIYVVKKGDTLYKIAKQYGLTVQELADYNGITDPDTIHTGQEIKIPVAIGTVNVTLTKLEKGMKGLESIRTVQRLLNALGYKGADGKTLSVDGSFGKNTDYAVRAFQQKRGVPVTGVMDKTTWEALIG